MQTPIDQLPAWSSRLAAHNRHGGRVLRSSQNMFCSQRRNEADLWAERTRLWTSLPPRPCKKSLFDVIGTAPDFSTGDYCDLHPLSAFPLWGLLIQRSIPSLNKDHLCINPAKFDSLI